MAIVKMKKLRVMAMADCKEELLKGLQHLGSVEISEPGDKLSDPQWSALLQRDSSKLTARKSEITDVNTALAAIKRYAQTKEGLLAQRGAVSEAEFLSDGAVAPARAVTEKVGEALSELSRLQAEESRLVSRMAALQPWSSLDMPLELEGSAHTVLRLGVLPGGTDAGEVRTALSASEAAAEIFEISADKQQSYNLLICYGSDLDLALEALRPFGFSVTNFQGLSGTAQENIQELDRKLAENKSTQEKTVAAITASAESRDALKLYADRLSAEANKEENAERLLTDGTILFFEGWVPAENEKEVGELLERLNCAWETEDPTEEENASVPVKLKNNWFTRPLNMVTDMYSLPAYGSLDPNPLMAPFFILFYGIMMADMGYGLLMILVSLFVMKKVKPNGATTRHMFPLLGLCGVSTFLMGMLTGGFFGDLLPQLAMLINPNTGFTEIPHLFSPLDDALMVLIGSLALGLVQIFTGMAVNMYKQIRDGQLMAALCNEGAWFVVFILLGVAAVTGAWKYCMIGALVVLILTQGYGKKGIGGKIMAIGGSLYNNITGYFSDILSYSRLMALMLAGAVIAQVFNTLGAITGNVITFFLISMIGNALNFALNLLGCFVHDMRLQCLEYFGRFYEDGGKPFRPLGITTQYVDIVKK